MITPANFDPTSDIDCFTHMLGENVLVAGKVRNRPCDF